MRDFTTFKKDEITSLALGHFDGLHLGHMELIKRLDDKGALFIVRKGNANLTPLRKREEFIEYPCFFYEFEDIKDMNCEEFMAFVVKEFPNLKKIVVGYDFKFGKGRVCDLYDLKKHFSGEIVVVDEFYIDGISVHSSKIREFLSEGKIEEANRLLGREYSISANVITGQGIGKEKLVPTLNLDCGRFLLPKSGVYATRTRIEDKLYNSVTFIGNRVSTDNQFSIEVHILDIELEDTPKSLENYFVSFIRENRKFDSLEDLKSQIQKDLEVAKAIL